MRKSGYYWVRLGSTWFIGRYDLNSNFWVILGKSANYGGHEVDEIDEIQITREPKQ